MENSKNAIGAVILAAGSGSRMNSDVTKQKMQLCGTSVIKRCVLPFVKSEFITEIVVVCRSGEIDFVRSELSFVTEKPISYVIGGKTRRESAQIGFFEIAGGCELVAIHDGARPLVSVKNINDVCSAAIEYGAATASTPVTDTVKSVKDGFSVSTVDRAMLSAVQTPQVFRCELYKRACEAAGDLETTDDNMLLEALGIGVRLVDTGKRNIKITTEEDIAYAEFLINGGYIDA